MSEMNGAPAKEPAEIYHDLRKLALDMKPEMLGVTLDNDEQVYGAVIDMDISGRVATLALMFDGATSLYFSSGGGILGTGSDKAVAHATRSFLVSALQALKEMRRADAFDKTPAPGHFIYYFLTGAGVFTLDIDTEFAQYEKVPNFLFGMTQMVLNQVRMASKKQSGL